MEAGKGPQKIEITTGTIVRIFFISALAASLWFLKGLVLLVLTAIVIASAIEPGIVGFVKRGIPRVLAVLILYIVFFGALVYLVYAFLPPLLSEAHSFIAALPEDIKALALPAPLNSLTNLNFPAATSEQSFLDQLLSLQNIVSDTSAGAVKTVSSFFGGIFSFIIVTVLSFYFAIQEAGVESFLRIVTPYEHEAYVVSLWLRAKRKIGLWMQGQLVSSLIGGVMVYLGLLIFNVHYALLLSLFTAFAMLIPIFGSIIAAVPPLLVAFSTGGIPLALVVAGLYLIVNQLEAHLIHPAIVNHVVGVPPILVILALIAGTELAGFLGAVLAVPLAAAVREFINDLEARKRKAMS